MDFHAARKNLIKEINKTAILKVIRERENVSRADIAKITGLNKATVTNNINTLIKENIVIEKGEGDSKGGRKPILLELNKNAFYAIGVDMGIKEVRAAIVNLNGEVIDKIEYHYDMFDEDSIINSVKNVIDKLYDNKDLRDLILGIGIGVHGIVNPFEGISLYAPKFNWENINIKNIIENQFNLPVFIDNDVRAMALGEKWFGAAKTAKDFVFINVGSGIGAAIFINGQIYRGKYFGAGEIGHISIVENGPKCSCGNFGCLEVMASGSALEKRVISDINLGKESIILNLVNDDLSKITGEVIYKAAMLNDKLAIDALHDVGSYLGYAVSNLINILNPEMIIIGGGVSLSGDYLLKPLCSIAYKKSMKSLSDKTIILSSSLKENCGIIGAATLVLDDFFNVKEG